MNCGRQFQNKRKPQRFERKIWNDHVWKRQTVADLKETYGKGEHTIRRILDRTSIRKSLNSKTQTVVCVFDASHLGEETLLVARAPTLRTNLGWAWIQSETKEAYAGLRHFVESKGFTLVAVVLDGRTGIPRVLRTFPCKSASSTNCKP